jgi:hypothetical protein
VVSGQKADGALGTCGERMESGHAAAGWAALDMLQSGLHSLASALLIVPLAVGNQPTS